MANIDVESANKKAKECQIDFVLSLLESNDIIEIAIVENNQIIEFGTSSNSLNGSSCLFDKKYYVDGKEYVTIEDVKTTIDNYSVNGKISVLSIDGVSPSCYESRDLNK